MSLSDDFVPLNVQALDFLDSEVSLRTEKTAPDFRKFRILVDTSAFKSRQPGIFETLHGEDQKKNAGPFIPLVTPEPEHSESQVSGAESAEDPEGSAVFPSEESDAREEASHEALAARAWEEGFARGYAEGLEKGRSEGYDAGFAEGKTDGHAAGNAEGFESGRAEGLTAGLAEGQAAGEAEARAEVQPVLDALTRCLGSVETSLAQVVDTYQADILDLVFRIARRVIHASLDTDDTLIRHTVLEAVRTLARPLELDISVSPEDYAYMEMVRDTLFESIESLTRVTVRSDALVPRGGCRIESDTAQVSTDPETRLNAVYEAVKGAAGP